MPIFIAVAATPLAQFAEGAVLGASVYLVSRGFKNMLRTRKRQEPHRMGQEFPDPSYIFCKICGVTIAVLLS